MNIRYRVELNEGERAELTAMLSGGKHAARKLKRAQILPLVLTGRRRGDQRRSDREQYLGGWVYGLPDQTALRGRQP